MSAGGLARIGVRCPKAATGIATLGVFCIITGGSSRQRKESLDDYDKLLHREDDEVISIILAISRKR